MVERVQFKKATWAQQNFDTFLSWWQMQAPTKGEYSYGRRAIACTEETTANSRGSWWLNESTRFLSSLLSSLAWPRDRENSKVRGWWFSLSDTVIGHIPGTKRAIFFKQTDAQPTSKGNSLFPAAFGWTYNFVFFFSARVIETCFVVFYLHIIRLLTSRLKSLREKLIHIQIQKIKECAQFEIRPISWCNTLNTIPSWMDVFLVKKIEKKTATIKSRAATP